MPPVKKEESPEPELPSPAVHDTELRMRYEIARGEQGVLTFEPYKSILLPLWRFKTVSIARKSSEELWAAFEKYGELEDFVGMDMARKFIQMGMTRAKRYANHAGGRKYDAKSGKEIAKSSTHKGAAEKLEASEIFREVWNRCRIHKQYLSLKANFQREQREWKKEHPKTKDETA